MLTTVGRPREGFPCCDDEALCCPTCGSTCVHLGTVLVSRVGRAMLASAMDVQTQESPGPARGCSFLTVDLFCEAGHHFDITLWTREGGTSVIHRVLPDAHGGDALICTQCNATIVLAERGDAAGTNVSGLLRASHSEEHTHAH